MRKINILNTVCCLSFVLAGCASHNAQNIEETTKRDMHTKAYELKITPVIGSRQDDAKVIRDMGKILKVWVAPYKNKGTFVSAHDNFVVAKEPDFIIGEAVPQSGWKSMKTPVNNIPFVFRDADMDTKESIDEETIVKYNNNVYKQQNDENIAKARLDDSSNIFDNEIKKFLGE